MTPDDRKTPSPPSAFSPIELVVYEPHERPQEEAWERLDEMPLNRPSEGHERPQEEAWERLDERPLKRSSESLQEQPHLGHHEATSSQDVLLSSIDPNDEVCEEVVSIIRGSQLKHEQLEQERSRLVPSSRVTVLEGGGSVFSPPELKHISGTSGHVKLPQRDNSSDAESRGGASFCAHSHPTPHTHTHRKGKEKPLSDWLEFLRQGATAVSMRGSL